YGILPAPASIVREGSARGCSRAAMIRTGLSVLALTGALGLSLAPSLAGGTTVGIVVVREHGVGSQTLAQPYLDRFAALAAALNGWGGAAGRYFTSRDVATAFIEGEKPHYGI